MSTPKQPTSRSANQTKALHPNNLHNRPYDFSALVATHPPLARFVARNQHQQLGIDFANPEAVKTLNAALLQHHYHINHWNIPEGALCPPVPGRADYIHYMAQLLNVAAPTIIPAPESPFTMLDIGTGSSGIYPLLATQLYGWRCVASDINRQSLDNVANIIAANPALTSRIALRQQHDKHQFFAGIIQPGEHYDLNVCNPPFHTSEAEALKGSLRKIKNLARNRSGTDKQMSAQAGTLNFGGQAAELWCNGGERLFLKKLIKESHTFAHQCRWFSSLVSKSENVPPLTKQLRKLGASQIKEIPMSQGNKITRVLAWSFTEQ
ncbi:23S rRNA (adenine(1618)-N(6))-methyltransferase RlmF [Gilvimarinus agarilyticus]|uniref:23S rRNA (adenine(1618)-N(6))-methyltransferase RlmF n=1 Tax=Gilvimarinus agarilyticus TaxID=679259 RepID=UPI0005A0EE6D|nr:23S rRNA (adenine(1618)-N(6))-methyltransferase RlmF [Gilvimarinus agarilyticus]